MNSHEINYRLKTNNYTQTKIARELKVSPHTVNNVIFGRATSKKIATLIAERIGKPLEQVFPQYKQKAA